jgi:hypothetical protein
MSVDRDCVAVLDEAVRAVESAGAEAGVGVGAGGHDIGDGHVVVGDSAETLREKRGGRRVSVFHRPVLPTKVLTS